MLTEKMGRKVDGREVLKGEDLRELGSLHHGPPPLVWLIEKKKPKKKHHLGISRHQQATNVA